VTPSDNMGMRAQELVDLDVNHLRFSRPFSVRIYGKGRKERICPSWKETIHAVRKYLERRSVRFTDAVPLFLNVEGHRLSRFGLRYIIAYRVAEAAKSSPTLLTRRVSPHTVRHTTAMHLLQSNVDLNMIRSWLGHASIETTNAYVEIDLEMKRKTLKSCENLLPKSRRRGPSWQRNNESYHGCRCYSYLSAGRWWSCRGFVLINHPDGLDVLDHRNHDLRAH
jgi:integrase/recombinase XerC